MGLPPLQRLKVKICNSQMHLGFLQPEGSSAGETALGLLAVFLLASTIASESGISMMFFPIQLAVSNCTRQQCPSCPLELQLGSQNYS